MSDGALPSPHRGTRPSIYLVHPIVVLEQGCQRNHASILKWVYCTHTFNFLRLKIGRNEPSFLVQMKMWPINWSSEASSTHPFTNHFWISVSTRTVSSDDNLSHAVSCDCCGETPPDMHPLTVCNIHGSGVNNAQLFRNHRRRPPIWLTSGLTRIMPSSRTGEWLLATNTSQCRMFCPLWRAWHGMQNRRWKTFCT